MRGLALLLPLLAACSLTLEVVYPGHRIARLETQPTYCAYGNTRVDYRFYLEGRVDRLEFYWVPEGKAPWETAPQERLALGGPIYGGYVRGFVEVTPDGSIQAVSLVSPQGASLPQGIGVEPALPDRRLWLRGFTGGVAGPYVAAANPVRGDASSFCDPSW
ncbi:hypothetical protein TthHB5008_08060 [Thermus thermophilus]|uniref:hypothetical protein n=1 Tax=Thermus thermophilus TaxID=274 RepID=UPI00195007B0|nr:hypothetical protein [Thermus thermophilus]BCP97705.1 hypothetical protein TthHB5002_08080 [Thermus thermophilus]BCQ00036.1 hypothetical protein TthHB5008_08060 [Thermus thermophilus]